MTKLSENLRMWVWLFALPLLLLGARAGLAQSQPAMAQSLAPSTQTPAAEDYTYKGTESCLSCHKTAGEQISRTVHTGTYASGSEAAKTSTNECDGCHGPGKAHAEAELEAERNDTKNPEAKKLIFDFDPAHSSPEAINKRCLTCHASGPTHLNSANSFHRLNDVSCVNCHSPHHSGNNEKLLVKAQPELCYSCHLQQKSQFDMPFRHRVNEGLIQCTDCHDQHGSAGVWQADHMVRQIRTSSSGDFVCFKCHADKQGPFVFEHAVVKTEGCS
ncbi:MAG: cytochrome c3 family protein, partial [Candidatus Acidiferrales bacterium]